MNNTRKRDNNGNNGDNNKETPLGKKVTILEEQVRELKASCTALQVAHTELTASNKNLKNELTASNTGLKSCKSDIDLLHKNYIDLLQKIAHDESTTSNTESKKSFTTDVDLLDRLDRRTLELCPSCERNTSAQAQGSFLAIETLEDEGSSDIADMSGQTPSLKEDTTSPIPPEHPIPPENRRGKMKETRGTRRSLFRSGINRNRSFFGRQGYEEDLNTDIFSIFLISKNCSATFFYPLMVAASQYLILALILVDLLWDDDSPVGVPDDNIGNVPVKVSPQVAAAQFISLVITFVWLGDVITSLKIFINGYDPDIQEQHPGASYCKFILANSIRFFQGVCTIAVSTILIIQTSDVMEIFLNFAALSFISWLENLTFELAEKGLCGRELKETCKKVKETKMKVQAKRISWEWLLSVLSLLLFLPFMLMFLLVRIRQNNGHYLINEACNNLQVQFADEMLLFEPNVTFCFVGEGINKTLHGSTRKLPFLEETPHRLLYQHFSGVYEVETEENNNRLREINSRPVYWERGFKDPTSGKFYYCDAIKSWVFTIEALYNTPGAIPEEAGVECQYGWLLQSPVTTAMTLDEAPIKGWNIWTGDVERVSWEFSIECIDCERNSDCGVTHGTCDLETSTCICTDNWQGNRCQVRKPFCPALVGIHDGESSFDYAEVGPYSLAVDDYNNNEVLLFYDRPGYHMPWIDDEYFFLDMTIYTGRRWFAVYWDIDDLEALFNIGLEPHAYWDNILSESTVEYSDPTENYYPTSVNWNDVRTSRSRGNFGAFLASYPFSWRYECIDVDCMDDNSICGDYGTCVEGFEEPQILLGDWTFMEGFPKSYCKCNSNYGGHFCEHPPDGEYSGRMYEEYLLDPVAYYNNNSENQYLKYWTNHVNETMIET